MGGTGKREGGGVCLYLFKRIVTASLPQVSVAWSPLTVVMVPSMRTVLWELPPGANAWRWPGRIRGVDMELAMLKMGESKRVMD